MLSGLQIIVDDLADEVAWCGVDHKCFNAQSEGALFYPYLGADFA
jgi:hypothetical protein